MKGIIKDITRIFSKKKLKKDYENMTITERIDRVMRDKEFKDYCTGISMSYSGDFSKQLDLYEKIAKTKVSRIFRYVEPTLSFSEDNLRHDIGHFFMMLDKLSPNKESVLNKHIANMCYLKFEDEKFPKRRSYTSVRVPKRGGPVRTIFINREETGNGALREGIHEVGHSMSRSFTDLERFKDERMREVCTVILDNMANKYVRERYPLYTEELLADEITYHADNVDKAKSALVEACVVKVMTQQMTLEEAKIVCDGVITPPIIDKTLSDIESGRFAEEHEGKYLLPQVIAHSYMKLYDSSPELAVTRFKQVLSKDTQITVEEAISILGLPNKEVLLDTYVSELPHKIETLQNKLESVSSETREKN